VVKEESYLLHHDPVLYPYLDHCRRILYLYLNSVLDFDPYLQIKKKL
jgi:hypothetical protein